MNQSMKNQKILKNHLRQAQNKSPSISQRGSLCIVNSIETWNEFPKIPLTVLWGGSHATVRVWRPKNGRLGEVKSPLPPLRVFQPSHMHVSRASHQSVAPSFRPFKRPNIKRTVGVRRFVYTSVQLPRNHSTHVIHKREHRSRGPCRQSSSSKEIWAKRHMIVHSMDLSALNNL